MDREALFHTLKICLNHLHPREVQVVESAFNFAWRSHAGQCRRTGEPFVVHPVSVACLLGEMRMGCAAIVAALLHDTIEDTFVTQEYIRISFGGEISELVEGLSKLERMRFRSSKERDAENFRKLLMAMSKDLRVIIIKLADRLHNMQTLQSLPRKKRRIIARETLEVYAPLARRLGINQLADKLEDLGFLHRHPRRYAALLNATNRGGMANMPTLDTIKSRIAYQLEVHGFIFFRVIGRKKHLYSIYRKMKDRSIRFSEIMDVYAIRIIVEDIETCYRVLHPLHSTFKPKTELFEDYIANGKANGYQALHTVLLGPHGVPIEVQIRTHDMDEIANNGVAAHWVYKTQGHVETAVMRAQQWLSSLIEMQQQSGSTVEFLDHVKIDLFPDEIYVFSPKGDVFELPVGSTVLDYAFAIHTRLGETCVSARVDGQITSLATLLKSGQTVEILSSEYARPSYSWLDAVVTTKARSHLRQFFRQQREAEHGDSGKESLDNETPPLFESAFVDASLAAIEQTEMMLNLQHLGFHISVIKDHEKKRPNWIQGLPIELVLEACCSPVPGDPAKVWVDAHQKGHVHRMGCPNLEWNVAARTVVWEETIEELFNTRIGIQCMEGLSIASELAGAASQSEAKIEGIILQSHMGWISDMMVEVQVKDHEQLVQLCSTIRAIPSVIDVYRDGWCAFQAVEP